MYLFFLFFFLAALFFAVINHWRKKYIIKKVCAMSCEKKCLLLNELLEPFGYRYLPSQDLFTTTIDAWQREFGYCSFYDETAYRLHLIFDHLPIYFEYENKTWLIELWKGQYGINTGAEIGVYHADRILSEREHSTYLFQAADNYEMLDFSFCLFKNGIPIADMSGRHWWLTAFRLGMFAWPSSLCMRASIGFPDCEMTNAFVDALLKTGIPRDDICICYHKVSFPFSRFTPVCGCFKKIRIGWAMWCNRFFCNLFLFVTRPFCLSLDRILYLYYYLPFAFRRVLRIRKYKKRRKRG